MKKITVANQKGGVGKTDLCVNLSSHLADIGKKVLLIDVDPQGNASDYLGVKNPEFTTQDLLLNDNMEVKDIVQKTAQNNLDLIPANRKLAKAELELANDVGMQFKLRRKLKSVGGYDYVFMDTPPSLGVLTINALTASDKVLVPIQVNYFALDGVTKLMDTINAIKKEINPALSVGGFVLTMYDRRNKLSSEVEKIVRAAFKDKVLKTVIPINVKLAESPSYHKPIISYASWSRGAKAYKNLAKEFLK